MAQGPPTTSLPFFGARFSLYPMSDRYVPIILTAIDWPGDVARAVHGLASGPPAGNQVVVVADEPSPDLEDALEALEVGGTETLRTSARPNPSARRAWRRARSAVSPSSPAW